MSKSYFEICRLLDSDKHHHGYSKFYERFFERIKKSKDHVKILELGVRYATGTKCFNEYFENCSITGVDIIKSGNTMKFEKQNKNFNFIHASTVEKHTIKSLNGKKFDIIIDDASHITGHQIFCFKKYYELLNPGGIYIIEDVHTSYMKLVSESKEVIEDKEMMSFRVKLPDTSVLGFTHDSGVDNPKSAVNYLKSLVDEVNCYGRASTKDALNYKEWVNKEYASITFIKGSCIIEKFSD